MRRMMLSVLAAVLLLMAAGCSRSMVVGSAAPETDFYGEPAGALSMAGEMEEAPSGIATRYDSADAGTWEAQGNSVERMVIRTASLDLVVPDTEAALAQIQELAEELGGYVVSLDTYQYEQGPTGSTTIRVPAESFDQALERLKDLATTVRRESVSGQDVTDEYVDLESNLRHLRAKEEQLLEFLDAAEDTEAVLAVYEQLSYTQQEIEYVMGRMQYLENQAALSTITVSLTPDALAQPLEVGGWDLPGTFRDAVEILLDIVEFVVKAAIYLLVDVLPALLILAAPVVAVILIVRWIVRRRKRRRASG
ncbi:MAG: DUF4349 domain-containing protein [Anaerolineae bacterium]|nr:DUF4349 domain-containing protein [Anaerolineae bacterium]